MSVRYLAATAIAAAITLGLLTLMQALIGDRFRPPAERRDRRALDFVRLRRDEEPELRKRHVRRQVKRKPPPALSRVRVGNVRRPPRSEPRIEVPPFEPSLSLAGVPYLGEGWDPAAAPSDTEIVPLVRVPPSYPPRARARGIEGWVHLRFTVTARGTTTNIEVIDAEPKGYFERAATNAVKKHKYRPRVEDGRAVARAGVELVISFELED